MLVELKILSPAKLVLRTLYSYGLKVNCIKLLSSLQPIVTVPCSTSGWNYWHSEIRPNEDSPRKLLSWEIKVSKLDVLKWSTVQDTKINSILARERFRVGCWISRTSDFYMRSAAIWQSLLVKPLRRGPPPQVGSPGVSQELYSTFTVFLHGPQCRLDSCIESQTRSSPSSGWFIERSGFLGVGPRGLRAHSRLQRWNNCYFFW